MYFSLREMLTEQHGGGNGNSLKVARKAVNQVMRDCVSFIILISFSLKTTGMKASVGAYHSWTSSIGTVFIERK